ncbi:hypothetical protein J9B83_06025 [Marinomonas sp. A79]|uniref:Chromosome partition protein Smc n=1 Tax=Marinomonas vulgaris TaxID=2823372 RepID=A0ABS5HAK2_9GAMM|nr:hypothetical protein [Marinomonas vulgaris]MBR7888495.1 hypothetical protein [Marinomonas vulgaris]
MKSCKRMVIPITFGLLLSACSTTSQEQSDSMMSTDAVESGIDTSLIGQDAQQLTAPEADQDQEKISALEQEISDKDTQISSLQQKIADNQAQLAALNQSLDQKDELIARLQSDKSNIDAETLSILEEQKASRAALESRYTALTLDNDLLKRRISQLENENTALKQQIVRLESLPKNNDEYPVRYLALLSENTQLQQAYANLEVDNEANQQRLSALKKENLILGGALSDSRAQQQILWDRIRAFEVAPTITDVPSEVAEPSSSMTEQPRTDSMASLLPKNDAFDYQGENQRLRTELESLQNRVLEQGQAIDDYHADVVRLEAALDESSNYEARWKALDQELAQSQQDNAALSIRLNAAQEALLASQAELTALAMQLNETQQSLELNENRSITIAAAIDSLQSQTRSTLQNVQWQLPSEMALYDNFEILVSADVSPALTGQTYQAELITDSDIRMVSEPVASAVVQNARLQWRWRVAGLNEKPNAQLNLFVSQQMNFQDQKIQRQVYRGSETLSLINTNLLEKYGYWSIAILMGLLGGFLVGRLNKPKK